MDQMQLGESIMEKDESMEELSDQRLIERLHELVRKNGIRGAATTLGIDPRTVAASMEGRNLSWRVREALKRVLSSGVGSLVSQEEDSGSLEQRVDEMQERIDALEKDVSSMLEAGPTEPWPEVERRLDGFTQGLAGMNARLHRLEAPMGDGHVGVEPRTPGSEKETSQVHHSNSLSPGVVSKEPRLCEQVSYGPGMPLIEE